MNILKGKVRFTLRIIFTAQQFFGFHKTEKPFFLFKRTITLIENRRVFFFLIHYASELANV